MIEHIIGDAFIFTDEDSQHHKLLTEEIYSGYSCEGCYFHENNIDCIALRYQIGECHALLREDERYVIFKDVK